MRVHAETDGRQVVAVSGKHSIVLAMKWPEAEFDGLLGFAIRRRDPDRSMSWLKTVLRFEEEKVTKGTLYESDQAPIQSMIWTDFGLSDDKTQTGLEAGSRFTYEVFAVRGTTASPQIDDGQAVRVSISTEPEHDHGPNEPEVHFNRGLTSMQEYERLFGEGHQPEGDPAAMAWLSRDLETVITDFVAETVSD